VGQLLRHLEQHCERYVPEGSGSITLYQNSVGKKQLKLFVYNLYGVTFSWFSEKVSTHILLHETPERHPLLSEQELTLSLLLSHIAFGVATAMPSYSSLHPDLSTSVCTRGNSLLNIARA
jgi:hypothetical protein